MELSRTAEAPRLSCFSKTPGTCHRCALLIGLIVSFLSATLTFYPPGLLSFASAAMAITFVLKGAELGAQICHEEEADLVEWLLAWFLLAVGPMMLVLGWGSKDVPIGIIFGSFACIWKKLAQVLVFTPEFRDTLRRSFQGMFERFAASDASVSRDEEEPVASTSF